MKSLEDTIRQIQSKYKHVKIPLTESLKESYLNKPLQKNEKLQSSSRDYLLQDFKPFKDTFR